MGLDGNFHGHKFPRPLFQSPVPIAIPVETHLKALVILGAVILRYIQSVSGELDPLQYGILFSPWVKPGPKSHAYLLFGFTLARANARMLINAEAKRRSARNSVRASRPQSASAVAVRG